MESTALPVLVICTGTLITYWTVANQWIGVPLMGVYGIAIAATAMLSTCGIVVAIDSFGAGG
jgi:K(+)-stimulated pyrophosphate-energized sodium pump